MATLPLRVVGQGSVQRGIDTGNKEAGDNVDMERRVPPPNVWQCRARRYARL